MKRYETIDEFEYLQELELSKPKVIREHHEQKKIIKEEIEKKPFKEIKPIYRYNKDGELVDKYLNTSQMATKLKWREFYLRQAADKEKQFNGFYITRKHYTKEEFIEHFKKTVKPKKTKTVKAPKPHKEKVLKPKEPYIQYCYIYQYNQDGELIARYDNGRDIANRTNYKRNTIKNYSEQERIFDGYLFSRNDYTKDEAKELYLQRLNSQQMSYVYKDGLLMAVCTNLKEVKKITNTDLSYRKISYYKSRLEPINGYIISNTPL